jgi:RHS repeat-associated protein
MPFFEPMNFHTKAFIPLLLGLASLATVHGSLPSTTPTAETLHSRTPFDACHLSITRTDPFTNSSIIGLTPFLNVWGYLSATYRYDPYGRTIAQAGPMAQTNRYRFSSKEYHEPSGLYYYGYRFYSPELQRWLNRDPIAENGGINLYRFVDNKPNGKIDPDGEAVMAVGAVGYGVYYAGVATVGLSVYVWTNREEIAKTIVDIGAELKAEGK